MPNDHIYRFGSDFQFKESDKPIQRFLKYVALVVAVSLVVTVILYCIIALTVNTDVEGRLKRENKMYEKLYPQLVPQQELLDDEVAGLEIKDNSIYKEVFHNGAPSVDPINTLASLNGSDSIPNTSLISYSSRKSDKMMEESHEVEKAFRSALLRAAGLKGAMPPMALPLKDISFTQVGASVGDRMQPYLKAFVSHDGLDFIVSQGTPVYASGNGRVQSVVKSNNGEGNYVAISHPGGYVTKYCHLSTMTVKVGQEVKTGQMVGTVGATGTAFAPHLHYEVFHGEEQMDPINYIFASVTPEEYANMLYMAVNTTQSMD